MLVEFFSYLRTPCPRPVREMGYLKEMIGLAARERRCREAWLPHMEASRELIVEAAQTSPKKDKAVVLGSGLLFDIPLLELAEMFENVVLVDILHMPAVHKIVAGFENVELLQHDIAGVVEPMYRQVKESTPLPLPDADLPVTDADLVVSANVVSQLPVIPVEFANHAGKHSAAGLSVLAKALIEAHLQALADFPGTVCLISEVEHQIVAGGDIISQQDPLLGMTVPGQLGRSRRFWDWDFAPRPERHKQQDVRYKIEGYVRGAIR